MPYAKKVSRALPGLIVLILDDSGSMGWDLPGTSDKRYVWVERYTQHILKELLARSTETQGDSVLVKPRYYLQAVIYGSDAKLWSPEILDIEKAIEKFSTDGNTFGLCGGLEGTHTAAAFELACDVVSQAVADPRFKNSFPPLVFHLTDGEAGSDPSPAAEALKELATEDGNVLLVNAYIGTQTALGYRQSTDFPGYVDEAEVGQNEDNLCLYRMSSVAPAPIVDNLVEDCIFPELRQGSRLFFDVRTKEMLKHVIQVVGSIGTRTARQHTV